MFNIRSPQYLLDSRKTLKKDRKTKDKQSSEKDGKNITRQKTRGLVRKPQKVSLRTREKEKVKMVSYKRIIIGDNKKF